MRNAWRTACALSLLVLLFVPFGAAAAQAKTLVWQRWDADISVQPNGDLLVVETQAIEFQSGTFTQGFREIPQQYSEGIRDIQVFEQVPASGLVPLEHQESYRGDAEDTVAITWSFSPARGETRTFVLQYVVAGALRIYAADPANFCAGGGPACDILTWRAIPEVHDFPIRNSRVTVHLPPGGDILREPEAISKAPVAWRTTADNLTAVFDAGEQLQSGDGIQVRVTFAHGAVGAGPPAWQRAADRQLTYEQNTKPVVDLIVAVVSILILFGALAAVYLLWYLRGRDPQAGPVPEYLTEPPSELRPGLVGTLLDEKVDMRDITATLIDLARRGHAVLEERQSEGAFGSTSRKFWFKRTQDAADDEMAAYEALLSKAFFGRKDERSVSATLPRGFYNQLPQIREEMYRAVTESGLFRKRPDRVRSGYVGWGIGALVLAFVTSVCLGVALSAFTSFALCPAFGLGAFGVGLIVVSRVMPAKTRKGAEEAARWWAFRKYLENIEKYADIKAVADQFDKYLPYAVALNVDRKWVHVFSRVETTPSPPWYQPIWVGRGAAPWAYGAGGTGASGRLAKPASAGSPSLGESVAGGLNRMGEGMLTGLNHMSEGLITALNTTGRTFSTPPAPPASSYRGGGGSGWSGGGFSGGGGGFSGGGGSGGFR